MQVTRLPVWTPETILPCSFKQPGVTGFLHRSLELSCLYSCLLTGTVIQTLATLASKNYDVCLSSVVATGFTSEYLKTATRLWCFLSFFPLSPVLPVCQHLRQNLTYISSDQFFLEGGKSVKSVMPSV